MDVNAVGRLLARGRYIDGMPTFTLADGEYDYLAPAVEGYRKEMPQCPS